MSNDETILSAIQVQAITHFYSIMGQLFKGGHYGEFKVECDSYSGLNKQVKLKTTLNKQPVKCITEFNNTDSEWCLEFAVIDSGACQAIFSYNREKQIYEISRHQVI